MVIKVIFRNKSSWQKEDCLFCKDKSTLEAVCGKGNVSATIRCCRKKSCKDKAAEWARKSVK